MSFAALYLRYLHIKFRQKKCRLLRERHRRHAFSQAAKLSYTSTLRFNCNAIRHSSTNENYTVEYLQRANFYEDSLALLL